jgi:ATP-dependent DNA helicase RecG
VKIIALITDNSEITIPEIADTIGISTRAVEKHLAKLKLDGIIVRTGSDKVGKWKIINKETKISPPHKPTQV